MDIDLKHQELTERYAEKRKRIRMNVIELIIGLVLLTFAFNYLKSHPAERTSIFAWLEVLVDKVEVLVWSITGGNSESIKEKQQLERWYGELISTSENANCALPAEIEVAKRRLNELKKLSWSEYKQQMQKYQWYIRAYASKVTEECGE